MNYIDEAAGEIAASLGTPDPDMALYRLYALLALTAGANTTPENVHDAWAARTAGTRPDHPALVPFAELAPEVQALDRPYADAIVAFAARRSWAEAASANAKAGNR